jgi:pimeloyl-ACP methyl ester carboxylesterase
MHWFWRWYLERRGIPAAVLYIPLRDVSLADSAEVLRRELDANDVRSVVLVGISTGGLTCLSYLQRFNGWERVDGFIPVAAPFLGAQSAILLSFIRNMRALLPNGPFITTTARENMTHLNRILCLSAAFDELVPRASSLLPGAAHEVIEVVGHNNLHVTSRATYDRIAEWTNGVERACE